MLSTTRCLSDITVWQKGNLLLVLNVQLHPVCKQREQVHRCYHSVFLNIYYELLMLSILECRNTEHEIKVHPEIRMSSTWSWAWLCCLHLPRAVPAPARSVPAVLSVPAWFRISLWADIGCFSVLFLCSCLFGSPAWAVYSALSRRQLVGNEESLCYLWQVYCFSCEEEPNVTLQACVLWWFDQRASIQ